MIKVPITFKLAAFLWIVVGSYGISIEELYSIKMISSCVLLGLGVIILSFPTSKIEDMEGI